MSDITELDQILLDFERVATEAKLNTEMTDTQVLKVLMENRAKTKALITRLQQEARIDENNRWMKSTNIVDRGSLERRLAQLQHNQSEGK